LSVVFVVVVCHVIVVLVAFCVSFGIPTLPFLCIDSVIIQWRYAESCADKRMECYFMPLTNCSTSLHAVGWENAPSMANDFSHRSLRIVKTPADLFRPNVTWFKRSSFVPPPWSHKDIHWWRAQTSKYLSRPSQFVLDIVAEEQRKAFPPDGIIPHPMISIFVRHGDKWKESKLLPFSEYMNTVNAIANQHNIVHIYLGTEDPTVIEEAKNNYSQYTFHYIETKRYNGGPLEIVDINGGADLMRVSLADLFIQIQGDVFIGTRSSNWCRLIDELRKANGKARIPFLTPENNIWPED